MKFLQKYALPILVVISLFFLGWIFGHRNGRQLTEGQINILVGSRMNDKLAKVVSYIGNDYIEPITPDSLAELAIPAILEKLDPHSAYIPAREFKQVEEPLQGEFDGIGVVFNMATDTVIILNVIPSGPSQKAGIIAGDRIIKVNDTIIAGQKMPQSDVMKRLRGPRGTQVNLSLKRQNIAEPVVVTVTRDAIPLNSVEATVMLTDNIGFIRLSQFARTSHREIKSAIDTLRKQGMKSLILDLRGNSGGFLDQAILIANEFLERGKLIVYTEDRNQKQIRQHSDGRGKATDLDIAVLIDESSASSSEILAGALQDNDRGTIIGRRSFGKGLVQQQIPFADGSAMRLTVARYYTPSGRCIQKPYKLGDKEDYAKDVYNRYKDGELMHADSIHVADSLKYTTLKSGRAIYGGGGIIPDVFVPVDTTEYSDYYGNLNTKGVFIQYTLGYVDEHRDEVKAKYADVNAFDKGFVVTEAMVKDLIAMGEKEGVKYNEEQFNTSKAVIELILKSLIARDVYDQEAFTIIYNHRNELLKEGMRVINDDEVYKNLLK